MKPLFKKIDFLNKIAFDLITEENLVSIIKAFTEGAVETLEADYGYAFGKLNRFPQYQVISKTVGAPDKPSMPMLLAENGVASVTKKKNIISDSDVKKENYRPHIDPRLKSYIIISLTYGDHLYGHILLGYKNRRAFSDEEFALANAVANNASHLITINWLIENERKSHSRAEKQKEMEILLAQEKLRSEFIADATHEFRTPLAIIRGNIDLLKLKGFKKRDSEKIFKDITHEIEYLSELLSDLSVLASGGIESYRIKKTQAVDLPDLVRHAAEALKKLAYERKISIKVKKMPEAVIIGNTSYLEKLFRNLIKNSITYGKERGLTEITGSKGKNHIKITVKDNGVGISKEDLPNVFRRFFKTESSKAAQKGGVGLGLAISKRIAEEHGGGITVKSKLGQGSSFTVSLPLTRNPKTLDK